MTKAIKRYDRMLIEFFIIALLALLLSGIIQSSMLAQSEFRGAISKNAIALTVQDDHAGMSALCNALMSNDECTAIYKVFPYARCNCTMEQRRGNKPSDIGRQFFYAGANAVCRAVRRRREKRV